MAQASSNERYRAEIKEKAVSRFTDRHTPADLEEMTDEEAEAAINEVVSEVMDDENEARTNVASVPSGEWDDYDGVTDEWGVQLGQESTERVNRETERTNHMAGVPQDVERDTDDLGEQDLSDVPAGEWDSPQPTATERVNRASERTNDDDLSHVPNGEWGTSESRTERLNHTSSDAMTVLGRFSDGEWSYRHEVSRTNDGMSQWDYTQALKELSRSGLLEKESGRRPYRYRKPS